MDYGYAFEKRDFARIDKLNGLTDLNTFYNDVRKFTKNIVSDHAVNRWEHLSEVRWIELMGKNDPEWIEALHDTDLLMKKYEELRLKKEGA